MIKEDVYNRMLGCLYGQAIGDALGFGTEAMTAAEVKIAYPTGLKLYSEILQDNRRKGWPIGMWTDDTEMMLCVMEAYVRDKTLIATTLADIFINWYDKLGYTSGQLTRKVVTFAPAIYKINPFSISELVWKLKNYNSAPNGGLMRTSIVGLWPNDIIKNAELLCKMTHYDPRCIASCVIITMIIYSLVWENKILSKEEIIKFGCSYDKSINEWIELAYNNIDITSLKLDDKESMAYTYRTLAAALWCYWHASSFEDGLLKVVNEGGDADTNAAVACAILGAKYGYNSIPQYYIDNLYRESEYRTRCKEFIKVLLCEFNCVNSE